MRTKRFRSVLLRFELGGDGDGDINTVCTENPQTEHTVKRPKFDNGP